MFCQNSGGVRAGEWGDSLLGAILVGFGGLGELAGWAPWGDFRANRVVSWLDLVEGWFCLPFVRSYVGNVTHDEGETKEKERKKKYIKNIEHLEENLKLVGEVQL